MPEILTRPRRSRWHVAGSLALTSALVAGIAAIGAPAAAAVGGPTSGDPLFPNVGNSGYDVQHYDIDLDYRSSSDISATTTIDAVAASPLTSIALDFEGLTVDGVTVNGAPATWTRDIDAAATKYKLLVSPATPVSGPFTVAVAYSGAPVRHIDADGSSEGWVPTADGVTALGQPVGAMTWYPQNNTPADKATYSIDVTAPTSVNGAAISVASTGELVGRIADDVAATTTWQWRQTEQMASELSVLAIGRFTLLESDITLASGRTLHEWTFVDSTITNLATVTTRRNEMKPIIDWLETKLGPYPGNSVGFIVDPPVRGSGINYALETQDRPFYPSNPGRTTFIHELVHQWLGNNVSPSTWDHIWMSEGGAEFFTDYYLYGTGQTATTPEDASYSGWNGAATGLWTTPSVGFTDSAELYEWQVYNRGKYALGALMTAVGRDAFDATYALWNKTHGGASVTTREFVAAAEQASGRDLDAFFQDWIYDTDKPAWPARWTAGASTDAVADDPVLPGAEVTLTLDVTNTGRVPLSGATIVADATAALAQSALPATLPAGISVSGTTVTWTVPDVAVGGTASVELPLTIAVDAPGGAITVPISAPQLGSSVTAVATFQIAGPVPLNLLNINDFHGRIDANTVKFAGTIEQLRAQYGDDNTLFLSDGDNIGASLFASSYFDDEPTIEVLNALGLSASAVGNHEFDTGIEDLRGRVAGSADFRYLGANVYKKGTTEPLLPEYALFTVGGLTVGVVGAVTEETPSLVSPGGIEGVDFGDPVAAVNRVAAQLTDGDPSNGEADVIIAEYHEGASAGTPDGATLEQEVAGGGAFADIVTKTADDVDVIFTGHTHKAYAWTAAVPGAERTRAVVQTGNYGENIGQVVLQLDPVTGDVESFTAGNVPRTKVADADLVAAYPRVAEVKTIVDRTLAAADVVGAQPVGSVASDITTAFSGGAYVNGVYTGGTRDDRASASALGNLVADSIRDSLADPDRGGAQIGVVNPGGLRAELLYAPDGVVTYAEANAVLPFVNNLWTTTLTGAQFTAVLEEQWQLDAKGNVPSSRPYLALGLSDNVHYTFDPAAPQGSHITGVWIDGVPIDPTADYRVGSFNFLLQGGDNFRTFAAGTDTRDSGLVDRDAWVAYLQAHAKLAPSFATRGVQVTGVPASAVAGGTITLNVAGLDMRSLGAPANTTLEPSIAGTAYPEVAVSNGAASVTLTLPNDRAGRMEIMLEAPDSGTVVRVPITVQPGTGGQLPSTGPGVETPAPESALTPGTQNQITVQGGTTTQSGKTLTIHVGEQYAGEWVSVWLRSDPLLLGWYRVDALGNITVTLPAGIDGAHRLIVQDAAGNVIGWQQLQVGALPATGGDASPLIGVTLAAMLLVGVGIGARSIRRRRMS